MKSCQHNWCSPRLWEFLLVHQQQAAPELEDWQADTPSPPHTAGCQRAGVPPGRHLAMPTGKQLRPGGPSLCNAASNVASDEGGGGTMEHAKCDREQQDQIRARAPTISHIGGL